MPCIKMRTDTAEPRRLTGKLYRVTQAEGWELVRDGQASWKYVPESKSGAIPPCEPEKEIRGAVVPKKANK